MSFLKHFAIFICLISLLNAEDRKTTTFTQKTKEDMAAEKVISEFEKKLSVSKTKKAKDRIRFEKGLKRTLERIERKVEKTKYVNKALFWLANWHLEHGDASDAMPVLQRLNDSPYFPMKKAGKMLKVRLLLKTGKLAEAKKLAEKVEEDVPEFGFLKSLISFHEKIGSLATKTDGTVLKEPSAEKSDDTAWKLYAFINIENDMDAFLLNKYMEELTNPAYNKKLTVSCVTFSANPLSAMRTLNTLKNNEKIKLIWANPTENGDAKEWKEKWELPKTPTFVLLTANNIIMSIDPELDDIRLTAGIQPKKGHAPLLRDKPRINWR